MGLFQRPSRKELENRVQQLEHLVSHLKHNVAMRKGIAKEIKETCVQRELDALRLFRQGHYDILINADETIRMVSDKCLGLTGYEKTEILGIKYYKLLAGNQGRIRDFFRYPESRVQEISIKKKPDINGQYKLVRFIATTYPVLSYDERIGGHRFVSHAYTRVYLEEIKSDEEKEKQDRLKIRQKVANLIQMTSNAVDRKLKKRSKRK